MCIMDKSHRPYWKKSAAAKMKHLRTLRGKAKAAAPVLENNEDVVEYDTMPSTPVQQQKWIENTEDFVRYDTEPSTSTQQKCVENISEVETSTTETISTCDVNGRRFFNLEYFFQKIKEANDHSPFSCSLSHMKIISEKRDGLRSVIVLKCSMCNTRKDLPTEPAADEKENQELNINAASVLACVSTGCGYSQLQQQLAILNIPHMPRKTFEKNMEKVSASLMESSWKVMEEAGREEAQLALERGDVDKDGVPMITVIADGAWSKRSYKTNYDASSGVACIVGAKTGKLLFIGVRNKYCAYCDRAASRKVEIKEHLCFKNWSGPSTAIEADIIVEGFKKSVELHNLKYTCLVGDGDSSVFKKICEAKPYGSQTVVKKVECTNHLLRNFCAKLKELGARRLSSSKSYVSPQMRQILKQNVLRLRTGIKKALEYRGKQNLTITEQTQLLAKDILNAPKHVFGDHTDCENYFCQGIKENEVNYVPSMNECGLMKDIMFCCNRLVQNVYSLLLNMNNNAAETYNSVVCKYIGGKRINFSLKNSYEIRCQAACISYNKNEEYYRIVHKSLTKRSPGSHTKRFIEQLRKRREWYQNRRKLYPKPSKKKTTRYCGPDKHYGQVDENDEAVSLDDIDIIKQEILNSLHMTKEKIIETERATVGQNINPLWAEMRNSRLTASHFGEVCKQRSSTNPKPLANRIIHGNFCNSAAMQWGRDHKAVAKQEFEIEEGKSVENCGIFISEEYPYLGASPDGLLGPDAIVEIKCPHKIGTAKLNLHPIEAVEKKLLPYLHMKENSLVMNTNHNYYYQVQGQLAITKRRYCYFVVWSNKGYEFVKVENDENFWKEKMLPKLKHFYLEHMLPLLALKEANAKASSKDMKQN